MIAKFRGVTVSVVPDLNGRLVDFLGKSASYPWVRVVGTSETYVWLEENIRPLPIEQLTMFGSVQS